MRVGILTFHNGTNYGGTLQAFATQQTIENLGHEAVIINYAPLSFRDRFYKCFTTSVKPRNIRSYLLDYFKEPEFRRFRSCYLNLSPRFYTEKQLLKNISELNLDACISGSDQVWSPYMAQNWGKPYFQNQFPENIRRIAYAVSFSCTDYPKDAMNLVRDEIKKFASVSVRETSGLKIMSDNNIENAEVMPDPTFLFDRKILTDLAEKGKSELITKEPCFKDIAGNYVYFYILQQNQKLIENVASYYSDRKNSFSSGNVINSEKLNFRFEGVEEWLAHIANSKFVVTNSFHGAVFSLLFHKPFILIPVEGKLSGMNDRIMTLAENFGLKERILNDFDSEKIKAIENSKINWKDIDLKIENLRNKGMDFLKSALEE